MSKLVNYLGKIIIILGVIALAAGVTFLVLGFSKQQFLVNTMRQEDIKLGDLGITGPDANRIIDSMDTAQMAGDTVRSHRHKIAPNYETALGGQKFDPTNPQELTYAQAINIENYLYLAVASFGLVYVVLGTGAFMLLTGVGLFLIGFLFIKISRNMD